MNTKIARIFLFTLFTVLLILSVKQDSQAQELSDACPEIVSAAVELMGDSCGALNTNTACYGYELVNTSFADQVPEDYFSRPADRAELLRIQNIETSALSIDNQTWGIAVLNVQANVPNTLPGQGVMFILMGESRLENRVAPEAVQPYIVPVSVTTQAETNGYIEASADAEVISVLPESTTVLADAQDATSTWLRVVYDDLPLWIPRVSVNDVLGLEALTVLTSDTFTPMQAFYFNTGVGSTSCSEAPNMVTVRSPENIQISLNINGADVRLGSMMTLRTISETQALVTLHEGQLDVVGTGLSVPAGHSVDVTMDAEGTIIEWGEPRENTDAEAELGITSTVMLTLLEESDGITQTISNPNSDVLIHIVQFGDTLFSIARSYEASMPAIVQINSITDASNIVIGQQLVIPNPGSGFVGLSTSESEALGITDANLPVDCSTLRPVSPTDGMNQGTNTFYWDEATGATSYRVRVTNLESGRVLTLDTTGAVTSLTANVGIPEIGGGFDFSWDVQALYNGEVACTSRTVVLQRGSGVVAAVFSASWGCAGPNQATISFQNAPAGDTVSGSFTDDTIPLVIPIAPIAGPNGVTTPFSSPGTVSNATLTGSPSGTTIPVSPASFNVGAC